MVTYHSHVPARMYVANVTTHYWRSLDRFRSPISFAKKYDKHGKYIRKFLPVLVCACECIRGPTQLVGFCFALCEGVGDLPSIAGMKGRIQVQKHNSDTEKTLALHRRTCLRSTSTSRGLHPWLCRSAQTASSVWSLSAKLARETSLCEGIRFLKKVALYRSELSNWCVFATVLVLHTHSPHKVPATFRCRHTGGRLLIGSTRDGNVMQ